MPNKHCGISFFKIITTASLETGKLKIPKGFTGKYNGDMSNPVFLKPLDDTKWEIHWCKTNGDIWFQKGWKEFSSYYSLDHGHLVLFEFKNASQFEVRIFDKSTLEIEYPMIHGNQDEQNSPDEMMSDNSVEILDELPPSKRTRQKSPVPNPQPHRKLRSHICADVGNSSKVHNFPKQVKTEVNKSQENMGGTSGLEHLNSKVAEALKRSKKPSFNVVMKSSYIAGFFMHVPYSFADTYLKKKDGDDIFLEVLDGRSWHGKYDLCRIKSGWKQFVLDNNLKAGDVCIFELTKKQPLSFKVLIFPLQEEPHPSSPQVFDPKSLLFTFGMQIDYSDAPIGGGFSFKNRNGAETCGCGKSLVAEMPYHVYRH